MVSVPIIYNEANSEVFMMTKDGSNLKVQRIAFDSRRALDNPVTCLYQMKCDKILLFSYHEGLFYLMEENKSIREIGKESEESKEYSLVQTLEIG